MPPRRTRPPSQPVHLTFDGATIVADADASVASALIAAGYLQLARSPKYHRPRGPACLRQACDGCLMRIDGVPNTMACVTAAREGTQVHRQNVVLTSKVDVLRATDWFFPNGMNHHELLAGVPGVQKMMLAFARRVSGLGELPDAPPALAATGVALRSADVLVVGAGAAGLTTAASLADAGHRVVLVDDQRSLGGALLAFPPGARPRLPEAGSAVVDVDRLREELIARAERAGVHFERSATSLGVLEGGDWLIDRPEGLQRVEASAHVVATGAHDGVLLFEGNDLPGVVSARAAGRLLRDGVLIGEQPVVVGEGPYAEAFLAAAEASGAKPVRVPVDALLGARGLSRVRAVVVRDGTGERRIACDAVVIDAPRAPAFEVAAQGGAAVRHVESGFAVVSEEHVEHDAHRVSVPTLFACGEVTGAPLDPAAFAAAANAITASVTGHVRGGAASGVSAGGGQR